MQIMQYVEDEQLEGVDYPFDSITKVIIEFSEHAT